MASVQLVWIGQILQYSRYLDRFGGRTDKQATATGFFYPKKIDDRWWLIDPLGGYFIHQAVVSVTMKQTPTGRKAFQQRYGNLDAWASETTELLRQHGFNGTGNWTDIESIKRVERPLVYTCGWNFMSGFGGSKKMTYQKSGHKGYPDDCTPVFHPEFESYCEEYAKNLAAYKDDPNLLGHFSDNELPISLDTLDKHLS